MEPVKTQNRWKSWVLWSSVGTQVIALLVAFGIIDVGQSQAVTVAFTVLLEVFVMFGVVNNPTNKIGL